MAISLFKLGIVLLLCTTVAAKNKTLSLPKGVQKFLDRYRAARSRTTTLTPVPLRPNQPLRRENTLNTGPIYRPVSGDFEWFAKQKSIERKQRPSTGEYEPPVVPLRQNSRRSTRPVSVEVGSLLSNISKSRPVSGDYGQQPVKARIVKPVERREAALRVARPLSGDFSQSPRPHVTVRRSLTDASDYGQRPLVAGSNEKTSRTVMRTHSYNEGLKKPILSAFHNAYRSFGMKPRPKPISDRLNRNPSLLKNQVIDETKQWEGSDGYPDTKKVLKEVAKRLEVLAKNQKDEELKAKSTAD